MQIIFLSKKFESYQIISEHLSDKEGIYILGLNEVLNEKQKNQAKILYFFFPLWTWFTILCISSLKPMVTNLDPRL